jgi:hypothetical protein
LIAKFETNLQNLSSMQRKPRAKIQPVGALSDTTIADMFSLFERYYVDVSHAQFRSDLMEKTHVFMFWAGDELIGFSTIFRKRIPIVGDGIFLFSGDTVIREDFWGSKILQTTFLKYVTLTKLSNPLEPVYWMLISKGFKTYMMMRKNFGYSFPREGRAMPELLRSIRNRFYAWKYGEAYDARSGLITFERSHGAVRGQMAEPKPYQLKDTDVRYFLERNPAYKEGVELACVAKIRVADLIALIFGYPIKAFMSRGRKEVKYAPRLGA